jgi:hypothetical protein
VYLCKNHQKVFKANNISRFLKRGKGMKKLWTMLFFGACCAISAKAQEEDVLRPRGKSAAETAEESAPASRPSSGSVRFSFGGETGLNYNMFSQDVERTSPVDNSIEDVLKSGNGFSRFISLFVDFPLTSSFGIQVKGLIDQKNWTNSGRGGIDIFDQNNGSYLETATMEASYDAVADYFGAALLLRADIGSTGFFVTAGPTYHVLVGDVERTDKVEIVEGMDESFINVNYELEAGQNRSISRTTNQPAMFLPSIPISNPSIGEFSSSRLGVEGGLGYRYVISSLWQVWPQVRYNYALSNVSTDTKMIDYWMPQTQGTPETTFKNSRLSSLQFSVSLVYNF